MRQLLLTMTDPQHTHNVQESADKIVLKTKLKRGTGTRDEDKIDVKVKGSDPETVVAKLNATLAELEDMPATLRGMQAGDSDA